jgi:hypothetical protein
MKSTLLHPLFILAVLLAATNQWLEKSLGLYIPFVHSYLDDILCFPIVLTTGLSVYRLVWPTYRLTPWHIWPLFTVMVIVFEVYLPTTSNLYTRDYWDVLAYLMGIILFQQTINKSLTETLRHKKTASIN